MCLLMLLGCLLLSCCTDHLGVCRRTDRAIIRRQGSRRRRRQETSTYWWRIDSGYNRAFIDTNGRPGWVCQQAFVRLPRSSPPKHSTPFHFDEQSSCFCLVIYRTSLFHDAERAIVPIQYSNASTHRVILMASSTQQHLTSHSEIAQSCRMCCSSLDMCVQSLLQDLAVEVEQGNTGSSALVVDRILGKPNEARKNLYSAIESISPSQRQQAREAISAVQRLQCTSYREQGSIGGRCILGHIAETTMLRR